MSEVNANEQDKREQTLGELTFEQAQKRLDETVQKLESGGLPLEEATRLYEEGITLAKTCNEALTSAELRISRIRTEHGEQMRFIGEESATYEA